MKKELLITLAFIAMSISLANAQSCCPTQKENCKPKICCPTTPECCDNSKAEVEKKKVKTVSANSKQNQKSVALKNEVAIAENKKVKL